MKSLGQILYFLMVLTVSPLLIAQQQNPDELVKRIVEDVLAAIKQDKDLQEGDRRKALALAEAKVLPYVDFRRMTMLAVGRPWRNATPGQQEALVKEFRALLIRTYSNSLGIYRNQTMEVTPLQTPPEETDTTVRSKFIRPNGPPIAIDYRMAKTSTGWKAYDIVVEGVSLVTTYRGSFAAEISRSGIDGLIQTLAAKNQNNETLNNKALVKESNR